MNKSEFSGTHHIHSLRHIYFSVHSGHNLLSNGKVWQLLCKYIVNKFSLRGMVVLALEFKVISLFHTSHRERWNIRQGLREQRNYE